MIYVKVWSLQRGILRNEPVSVADAEILERDARIAAIERDPPLTAREWHNEEGNGRRYCPRDVKAERMMELARKTA